MARYKLNLEGDRVLAAKLRGLTDSQAKKAILGACRESIKVIQKEAKTLAPKRTGALQRSIKVRAIARSRKRIGVRVTTAKTDNMYAGKTFYAAFQEFGWKTGKRRQKQTTPSGKDGKQASQDSGQVRRQIEGKEFMKQAADRKKNAALEIFRTVIDTYIRKVMTK